MYIYIALALYIFSLIAALVGSLSLSAVAQILCVITIGLILTKFQNDLLYLRNAYRDRVENMWIGAEYRAAIVTYVVASIATTALFLAINDIAVDFQLTATEISNMEIPTAVVGLVMLTVAVVLLSIVALVAWVYLIEVFTRDLYILQIASGVYIRKPHSATFYVILSMATLGFFYFYWLMSIWRWISQLKK